MEETWKDIPGYEGIYQASTAGRIKSLQRRYETTRRKSFPERVLKPVAQRNGYISVQLGNSVFTKRWNIHRLIAITFISNPMQKEFIDHIDHDKLNNEVKNLRWVTNIENQRHSAWKRKGLLNKSSSVVVHVEYGFFCTVGDAAKVSGIQQSAMSEMLSNNRVNKTKFIRA